MTERNPRQDISDAFDFERRMLAVMSEEDRKKHSSRKMIMNGFMTVDGELTVRYGGPGEDEESYFQREIDMTPECAGEMEEFMFRLTTLSNLTLAHSVLDLDAGRMESVEARKKILDNSGLEKYPHDAMSAAVEEMHGHFMRDISHGVGRPQFLFRTMHFDTSEFKATEHGDGWKIEIAGMIPFGIEDIPECFPICDIGGLLRLGRSTWHRMPGKFTAAFARKPKEEWQENRNGQ